MNLRPVIDKFERFASCLQSPLLFVVRVYWGLAFAQDGWGKLTHLERVASYFASLGIPMAKANVVLAASTQCLCGGLLVLGLFSRVASVPLIFTMLMAYATAERDSVRAVAADLYHFVTHLRFDELANAFNDTDKIVSATPFLFLFASVLVLVFGPGRISLDQMFFRRSSGG